MPNALLTPPSTPPPQQHDPAARGTPTPESRIGKFLGPSLELKEILGTGAYGVVYSAYHHATGIWYAVKALSKTNANGEPLDRRQKEFQSREIRLHYQASAHPNIVSMLKIEDHQDCTYVILEYCPEGDLFSNITERGLYVSDDASIRRAFLQILNAVEHCHNLGIYHRDLKPENILVAKDQVLLADFGLATTDRESEDHGCGSTFYMSPECLNQSSRKPSYRCAPNDIWSLGIILVNLTCGRNPWKQASVEDSTYKAFTRNRSFLKTILPLSDELNDILGLIFERNPEDRITVGQLKRRILECRHFTTPAQQVATASIQPITPPQSPCSSDIFDAPSPTSSCSETDSVFSNTGLSDSSDEEDFDSGYDSEDSAMDQDNDVHLEAVESPVAARIVSRDSPRESRPAGSCARPTVQFPQQYVLPQEPCSVSVPAKTNPYFQNWAPYPQPYFERPQAVPQVYQPCYTPIPQPYSFYPSPHQYAASSGWY